MTDAKIDDYTGETYNPEDEETYEIEVKTKRAFKKADGSTGKRKERLFFEVRHNSFMEIIAKRFEGKKILEKWQHWEDVSPEVKAKYPNARGKWVRNQI